MFNELTNFALQRTTKEAIGFYIVYFIVGVILGTSVGAIMGLISDAGFNEGLVAGTVVSVIFCTALGIVIAFQKGSFSTPRSIGIIVASGALAIFTGGLGGLIPIAYLTTTENLNEDSLG
ncbi:MAG: hypothetical protein AAGD96_07520 [Chloroflexota bacterium]